MDSSTVFSCIESRLEGGAMYTRKSYRKTQHYHSNIELGETLGTDLPGKNSEMKSSKELEFEVEDDQRQDGGDNPFSRESFLNIGCFIMDENFNTLNCHQNKILGPGEPIEELEPDVSNKEIRDDSPRQISEIQSIKEMELDMEDDHIHDEGGAQISSLVNTKSGRVIVINMKKYEYSQPKTQQCLPNKSLEADSSNKAIGADASNKKLEADVPSEELEADAPPKICTINSKKEPELGVEDGHVRQDGGGAQFSNLLNTGRFLVANMMKERRITCIDDVRRLRSTRAGTVALYGLTAKMYTYWNVCPIGPSIYEQALDIFADTGHPMHDDAHSYDVKLWGHGSCRPSGIFYVCGKHSRKGNPTVLVDSETFAVYLGYGLANSILSLVQQFEVDLPVPMRLTLLPFRGKLVCDGIVSPTDITKKPETVTGKLARKLAEIMSRVESGTILPIQSTFTYIPTKTGPMKISVDYIDGLRDTLKAELHLIEKVEKSDDFTLFRHANSKTPGKKSNTICIMNGSHQVGSFEIRESNPTIEEYIIGLIRLAIERNTLSRILATDDLAAVPLLQKLLNSVGIRVCYYPSPSSEEKFFHEFSVTKNAVSKSPGRTHPSFSPRTPPNLH